MYGRGEEMTGHIFPYTTTEEGGGGGGGSGGGGGGGGRKVYIISISVLCLSIYGSFLPYISTEWP